jgi:glycine oxidase
MIRALVSGRALYVVSRDDGTVLVGASSDESAERIVEVAAVHQLLSDVRQVLPDLDRSEFLEARVGLRPATSSQTPYFVTSDASLVACSGGHYRHGYLLAPWAAERAINFVRGVLQ